MSKPSELISFTDSEASIRSFFERSLSSVRDDVMDNPYITEAIKVLKVGGYRSAIGSFWNAVVDDLRNKIIHRSLALFNKSIDNKRDIKSYEDFQNFVNDDELIDGAYKIGVIGWEASKILKHAKETRHIFDGHPKSTDPSLFKVLAMFDDCIKYVLNEPYPPQIIDISEYIGIMDSPDFDRNEYAVTNAISDLPEIYKNELANRLFSVYTHQNTTSILRSNVDFVAPILWRSLPKDIRIQVVRRVDQHISKGNATETAWAFAFVNSVRANAYISPAAKIYLLKPIIDKLKASLDEWDTEEECVKLLLPYRANIPAELVYDYVSAITHTFVGYMGSSARYSRKDFYSDMAAIHIPKMFEAFDDNFAMAFVETVKKSSTLRRRLDSPTKLNRLRALANTVVERVSASFPESDFLDTIVDSTRAKEFYEALA